MNIIIVYTILDNEISDKTAFHFNVYSKWSSLENLFKVLKLKSCKVKYFDEECELISIKDNEDFIVFQNVSVNKKFNDNEILVLVYNKELSKKLRSYEYVKNSNELKPKKNHCDVISKNDDYFMDEISSSSSSSFERCKSKKHKSIKRYSAEIKKELNYLPGSEISDGQVIYKKWRIKNIGLKKWKNNSVKCVLLPSEYSNWVQYEDIKVPVCFADQKVNIEMKIKIVGRWTEEQLNNENSCQTISLKWLLFMDKLVKERNKSYVDYILTQLDLSLNVKIGNREFDPLDTLTPSLKKQTSESSIEKIDQDFSIVNMSDECEFKNTENTKINSPTKKVEQLSEIDIDLPECPNVDDFQITDFHCPSNFISNETLEKYKSDALIHNNEIYSFRDDIKPELISIMDKECDLNKPFENNILEEVNKQTIEIINTELELTASVKDDENITKMKNTNEDNDIEIVESKIFDIKDENESKIQNTNEENDIEVVESKIFDSKDENESDTTNDKIIEPNNCQLNIENSIEIIENKKETNDEKSEFYEDSDKMNQNEIIGNSVETKEIIKSDCGNKFEECNKMVNDIDNVIDFECSSTLNTLNGDIKNEVSTKHSLTFDQTTKPDITPLIKNSNNQQVNTWQTHNESNLNQIKNNFQTPHSQGLIRNPTFNNSRHPYVAGVIPNISNSNRFCLPNAPPCAPFNQMPMPYGNPAYPPFNPHPFNPTTPPGFQFGPVPIQNQSSDEIIRNLTKNGNIHDHINEPNWTRAENGQHYETTTNLQKLQDMGFTDRERNYRLLMKFDNNMTDVIHELID